MVILTESLNHARRLLPWTEPIVTDRQFASDQILTFLGMVELEQIYCWMKSKTIYGVIEQYG